MNAVTRTMTPGMWLDDSWLGKLFKKQFLLLLILSLAVLTSALGVVYVKQWDRQLFIGVQQQQMQRDRLETQWGQLLLEEGAWSTQARIQAIASQQLGMILPPPTAIRIIKMT
jgi:cell division protein FtsL